MLLQKNGQFNDLSKKLRNELETRVRGFGKVVRYKFDVSHPNPDPSKYNGPTVWPNVYTLNPTIFNINDPHEDREGVSRSKRIAFIDGVDLEKGFPNRFRKVRVEGKNQGLYKLNLENDEEFNMACLLELHPKNGNGMFPDKSKRQIFSRIDEQALATEQRNLRTAKRAALNAAGDMSDKQVVEFADAMQWDSAEDLKILHNKVEELAETSPDFFNDLVAGKTVEYQAAVKQALDRQIISFDPAEWKFMWTSNQQPITVLSEVDGKTHVQQMAEWLQIGGAKSEEVYKKMKSLLK